MIVRCSANDSAGSATPTPIAPGRATVSARFRPDVIAVRTGLAMRAWAGMLARAPIDEPHVVEHSSCGGIGVHGIPAPRARRDLWAQQGICQRPDGIWRGVRKHDEWDVGDCVMIV